MACAIGTNCAQRLSASRIISGQRSVVRSVRFLHVLNAFRHHGLYRGTKYCRNTSKSPRAQRLSASRIISGRLGDARQAPRQVCSTPFGITDYIGVGEDGEVLPTGDVLNAFRHHGLYRVRRPRGTRNRRSVLNAFRHHGLYRGRRTPGSAARKRLVLNAFRHHGLYRDAKRFGGQVLYLVCSTPFGITDYIGGNYGTSGVQLLRVLNAFRHHGLYRDVGAGFFAAHDGISAQRLSASRIISGRSSSHRSIEVRCSTPFGITDYIGLSRRSSGHKKPRAQRLSASRIISGISPWSISQRLACAQRLSASRIISGSYRHTQQQGKRDVLNAFRHHGLYRVGCCRLARFGRFFCAQRLSASRIISGRESCSN